MFPKIVEAKHVRDWTVFLRFSDGVEGEVDLLSELRGEVFEPLRDPGTFCTFRLHPELRTIVWPNGADFAPEFLRSALRIAA